MGPMGICFHLRAFPFGCKGLHHVFGHHGGIFIEKAELFCQFFGRSRFPDADIRSILFMGYWIPIKLFVRPVTFVSSPIFQKQKEQNSQLYYPFDLDNCRGTNRDHGLDGLLFPLYSDIFYFLQPDYGPFVPDPVIGWYLVVAGRKQWSTTLSFGYVSFPFSYIGLDNSFYCKFTGSHGRKPLDRSSYRHHLVDSHLFNTTLGLYSKSELCNNLIINHIGILVLPFFSPDKMPFRNIHIQPPRGNFGKHNRLSTKLRYNNR